ncbi:MFS transporter [Chryseobacterium polytrichastri]|uniref:Drug resistance transporter, EmrB/QacA subfamily n=1 Tax=Chryseobacterium polytrichastri TaxID=1302687 RepID=A0A1M6UCA8_9FLAO|nr:MFS transporter [Chryseobacterium polytrichastri]SHK66800.1 drug resistance transporter, EmrB/QacA subfamily [Chryseobacterium polytrichastri]
MRSNYLKLTVILFAQLLSIMDIFIINVSIPSIQRDIHASNGQMQLIIAAYLIGFASFLITGGRLGDLYGRKRLFIVGLILFMISSITCGFSTNSLFLIISRFMQGFSAALMSPQVLSMIQILFPEHHERTKAMSWYGITIGIGTILGQFLGGYFSSLTFINEAWRLIFFINIPICLFAVVLGFKLLDESKITITERFDFLGVALLAIGLFCFTYALTISEHGSFGIESIVLMVISVILLAYFIKNQKNRILKNKPYLIDFKLFTFKNFNIGILAVSFFFIMLDSYFYVLSIFFQEGLKINPLDSGEIIVFQGFGFILASVFSAKLILRYGKKVLILGLILIITVLMLQGYFFTETPSIPILYLLLFMHGVGVGSIIPSLANIALSGIPKDLMGNASGVYITLQQTAAIIGIIIVGSLFYYFLGQQPLVSDYQKAFKIALATNIICLIAVIVLIVKVPESILPVKK